MPSPRRLRLLALAAIATVVFFLFYTSGVDPSQDSHTIQDFYHKTMDGMKKGSPPGQAIINTKTGEKAGHIPADKDADGDVDEDDRKITAEMQLRLKQAEQDAKDKANIKGGLKPDIPSEIVGKGNSAEGQPKKDKSAAADKGVSGDADKTTDKTKTKEPKEESEAEAELSSILKKAPGKILHNMFTPERGDKRWRKITANQATSRHLLQDVLPLLQDSQGHSPRQIPHRPRAIRSRTR